MSIFAPAFGRAGRKAQKEAKKVLKKLSFFCRNKKKHYLCSPFALHRGGATERSSLKELEDKKYKQVPILTRLKSEKKSKALVSLEINRESQESTGNI